MRTIEVVIHQEAGTWWAESADPPGFSAAADTLEELRLLIREGVDLSCGSGHEINERMAAIRAL